MATRRETWHDALDAQMGVWRFTRSSQGQDWLIRHYQTTAEGLSESTLELLQPLYATEAQRILSGDPIFVSAEMCQLIASAADSFQPEPLFVTDLLTPAGFVYYEKPLVIPDRFGRDVSIAAVSWSPVINRRDDDDSSALQDFGNSSEFLTWLHARDSNREELGVGADGLVLSLYATCPDDLGYTTPLLLIHVTHWWFGMALDGNEVDENGDVTGAAWWWKIVQSTLRLMQQRIAVTHTEKAPRHMRRDAKRLNLKLPDVLVVRLRRERGQVNEPSGEDGNYSHRWIVHGFWRNQWYPVDQIHRQIFISDYVKGPQDKPLIVRPRRAFTWDR